MAPHHFNYVYAGEAAISRVCECVDSGHSAVVLGHANSGKSQLINGVRDRFERAGYVYETMDFAGEARDSEEAFRGLCDKHRSRKNWILVATELDSLERPTSRRLLEQIRTEGDKGRLQAVVTGESDLSELIRGPKSDLTNAEHFVVQGLDPDCSMRVFETLLQAIRMEIDPARELRNLLTQLTGGNEFLIRTAVWALVEMRKADPQQDVRGTARVLRDAIDRFSSPYGACSVLILRAIRMIESDRGCWCNLERLLADEAAPLKQVDGRPGGLTLSGVAVRTGGHLRFASELMERLVRANFDERRIADLYAGAGEWDEAFKRYEALGPELTVRPLNRDDRSSTAAAIQSLAATFYSDAARGIGDVKRRFVAGCRYLLGFPEVVFWVRLKSWTQDRREAGDVSDGALEAAKELPSSSNLQPGLLTLSGEWREYGLAAILSSVRAPGAAVFLGDFRGREPLSRERGELAKNLLEHFVKAHSHAVAVERSRRRLESREKHAEILTDIFDAMSHHTLDVGYLIRRVADNLRKLGYRRVLICLVNRERTQIGGIYDSSNDTAIDVAKATRYKLAEPTSDIQPYVVATGVAMIVDDARDEPLTNKDVVERAGMRSLALVPIRDRNGLTIGTIHVEREDGKTPSQDEVDDLEVFARQLSTAIQHGDRLQLMQSTLDQLPDPIIAVDSRGEARYANEAASRVLGISPNWNRPLALPHDSEIGEAARAVLKDGKFFRTVRTLGDNRFEGDLRAERILDWRDQTSGAFLHVHDLNVHLACVGAFGIVALASDPESAIDRLLEAADVLGHPWARIYLVDPGDASQLRSKRGYGFPQFDAFNKGDYVLKPQNERDRRWESIRRRKPMFFRFDPDSAEMSEAASPLGVEMWLVSSQDDNSTLRKERDQCWLDFPLITSTGVTLGKMTLGCDVLLSGQEYQAIDALSSWVANVFDAFSERDRITKEKHRWIEAAAELSMARMAHNMNTRFGSLPLLLQRYRAKEDEAPGLKPMNDHFESLLGRLLAIAGVAKERLGVVRPSFSQSDVVEIVRRCFSDSMPDEHSSVSANPPTITIEADATLLDGVIAELVANAGKAIGDIHALRMTSEIGVVDDSKVRIEIGDNGPGVPEKYKEQIFENFFHTHTGANQEGQGLGLNWVRRVVRAHGGTIVETGTQGEGARFSISLPLRQPVRSENMKEDENV